MSSTRRHLLRAGATALLLPWFEATVPRLLASEPPPSAPRPRNRMLCIYFAHGVCNERWYPAESGRTWQLSPSLEPLGDLKQRCTVLSGFDHHAMRQGAGHRCADSWLTACTAGAPVGSMDQVAAEACRGETRFASIQLGINSGTGERGRTHTLSFNTSGMPLPTIASPRVLFDRLFTGDDPKAIAAQTARLAERRSLLDGMLADARSLHGELPAADRHSLDQYLESLREVEQQIGRQQDWIGRPRSGIKPPDGLNLTPPDHGALLATFYELIALAFASDATRVITFHTMVEFGKGGWPELGIPSDHGPSHHSGKPDQLALLAKRDLRGIELVAALLRRLADLREGEDSLLDRTQVLYGSGLNNGIGLLNGAGLHGNRNLPLLVAGGERCGLKQGSHIRVDSDTSPPLANLFVTMLNAFGLPVDRFADSNGSLMGLG